MTAWYYVVDDAQQGPIATEELKQLVSAGRVGASTLLWHEGLPDWQEAHSFGDLFPPGNVGVASAFGAMGAAPAQQPFGPGPQANAAGGYGNAPGGQANPYAGSNPYAAPTGYAAQGAYGQYLDYTEGGFRNLYTWFCVLFGVGIPAIFIIIGIPMLIAAIVLQFVMLFRFWNIIQDGQVQTTPGQAVGFLFIPLFNLYWMFVAIYGLGTDMEKYCQQRGIRCHANSGLALTYCILVICGIIPIVGIVVALVNLVLVFILWHQFTSTAVEILRYRQARQPRPQWG